MTALLPPTSNTDARPRRRWLDSRWVRVGIVLVLIAAIMAFSLWWPRRTTWAVLRANGTVRDRQALEDSYVIRERLPAATFLLWDWFRGDRDWESRDASLDSVYLYDAQVDDRWLHRLKRCERLHQLHLNHHQVGPGLEDLSSLRDLKVIGVSEVTHLTRFNYLRSLPHLEKLTLVFRDDKIEGVK